MQLYNVSYCSMITSLPKAEDYSYSQFLQGIYAYLREIQQNNFWPRVVRCELKEKTASLSEISINSS